MLRAPVLLLSLAFVAAFAAPAHAAPQYYLDFYASGSIYGSHPGGANGYLTLERDGQILATSQPVADGNAYTKLLGRQPLEGDVVHYVIGGQEVAAHTFTGRPEITSACVGDTVVRGVTPTRPNAMFVFTMPQGGSGSLTTAAVDEMGFTAFLAAPLLPGRVDVGAIYQTPLTDVWYQAIGEVTECGSGSVDAEPPADTDDDRSTGDERADDDDDASGTSEPTDATAKRPAASAGPASNVLVALPRGGAVVRRGAVRVVLMNANSFAARMSAVLRIGGVRLSSPTAALGSGRRAAVAIKLSPAARGLLARRRSVKATLTVTLRDADGRARTRTWKLRVRAAKR